MTRAILLVLTGLALAFSLVSCSSADEGGTEAPVTPAQEKSTGENAAKDEIRGFGLVRECLEGVLYQLEQRGDDNIRINSSGGRFIADIDVHQSKREAREFADQLVVDGAQGGRFTVTYNDSEADDSAKSVIADCIRKAD